MSNLEKMLIMSMITGLATGALVVYPTDAVALPIFVQIWMVGTTVLGVCTFIAAIRYAMEVALENRPPVARQDPPPSPPQGEPVIRA